MFIMRKIIILNWMPWCWKTTVWKILSSKIEYTFFDLDDLVKDFIKNNLWIYNLNDFIVSNWWNDFRRIECECLEKLFNINSDKLIISLWWWTISCVNNIYLEKNIANIKNSWWKIIYLEVEINQIITRVLNDSKSKTDRPNISKELSLKSDIENRFFQRKHNYEKYSDYKILNNNLDSCINEIIKIK